MEQHGTLGKRTGCCFCTRDLFFVQGLVELCHKKLLFWFLSKLTKEPLSSQQVKSVWVLGRGMFPSFL